MTMSTLSILDRIRAFGYNDKKTNCSTALLKKSTYIEKYATVQ